MRYILDSEGNPTFEETTLSFKTCYTLTNSGVWGVAIYFHFEALFSDRSTSGEVKQTSLIF